jgi:hypothetical protein
MAGSKSDTSFPFGANVVKKATTGGKQKGGRRKRSAAQKATGIYYQGARKEHAAQRGQVAGSARCHAKVVPLGFADGLRLVFEGSANPRTNRNTENLCVVNDPGLHDWHAAWIDNKVREHEINQG